MKPIISPNYRVNAYSYQDLFGFGSEGRRRLPGNSESTNIFFISESVMRNNEWAEIVKMQLHKKRIRVTQTQLDSTDWRITYIP